MKAPGIKWAPDITWFLKFVLQWELRDQLYSHDKTPQEALYYVGLQQPINFALSMMPLAKWYHGYEWVKVRSTVLQIYWIQRAQLRRHNSWHLRLQYRDQVQESNIGAYVEAHVGNLKPTGLNRSAVEISEREETQAVSTWRVCSTGRLHEIRSWGTKWKFGWLSVATQTGHSSFPSRLASAVSLGMSNL